MFDLPLPKPDCRIIAKESIKKVNSISEDEYSDEYKKFIDIASAPANLNSLTSDNNAFKGYNDYNDNESQISTNSNIRTMSLIKIKQIEDMRKKILTYKLLTEKTMFINSTKTASFISKSNIILFGPSGSGKSSFIKSLYHSLYNSQYLPPEVMNKLIIKGTYHKFYKIIFSFKNRK